MMPDNWYTGTSDLEDYGCQRPQLIFTSSRFSWGMYNPLDVSNDTEYILNIYTYLVCYFSHSHKEPVIILFNSNHTLRKNPNWQCTWRSISPRDNQRPSVNRQVSVHTANWMSFVWCPAHSPITKLTEKTNRCIQLVGNLRPSLSLSLFLVPELS
jgi:hypothetical protein